MTLDKTVSWGVKIFIHLTKFY